MGSLNKAESAASSHGSNGTGPRRYKASLSGSPLARPDTLIHQLASEIQNYLYFPDPQPLYVTLGTVAANMIMGNPVWTVLVGPPGCGKTLALEMIADMPRTKIVSMISGPGALLSASGRRDIGKGATGGLLRELGHRGTLVMTDMAGLLKLPSDPLGQVLSAFRDIYGGRWVRPVGTDGGRSLAWPASKADGPGKITFLGASTPLIDRHHTLNQELGERWIYYRFPDSDGHGETQSALRNKNPDESMAIIRTHIFNFFDGLGLIDTVIEKRDFRYTEEARLAAMASLNVRARSEVPRDAYTKEIVDIAEPERPQRLASVLGQLYLGLEVLELPEAERWALVQKVALDSMPRLKREILLLLYRAVDDHDVTTVELEGSVGVSRKTVVRAVEDLEVHGVVEKLKETKSAPAVVRFTGWGREMAVRGWRRQNE